jgi:hypothetical protein
VDSTMDGRSPGMVKVAFSVSEFCIAHGISRAHLYNLLRAGAGPKTMKIGRRTLIAVQAASEWRAELENSTRSA